MVEVHVMVWDRHNNMMLEVHVMVWDRHNNMMLEVHVMVWDRHNNGTGLYQLIGHKLLIIRSMHK
jgi:hypothetical protein